MPAAVVDGKPKICLSSTPSMSSTTSGELQRSDCGEDTALRSTAWSDGEEVAGVEILLVALLMPMRESRVAQVVQGAASRPRAGEQLVEEEACLDAGLAALLVYWRTSARSSAGDSRKWRIASARS